MTWRLHTGTGAPGVIAGQTDGDNYIDTDAGDIYQLVGTTWSLCATFPGLYTTPPGDTTKFWRGDASWAVPPGGSGGDVTGPASATGDNLASFNGATGKIIKDSGSKTSDFAVAAKGVTNGDSHDHAGGDGAAVPEAGLSLSDVTTGDVSVTEHGFAPKAPNDATKFLDGTGAWDTVKESDIAGTAWTAFTPSWTNLTVGSGTNTGYYKQIGKTVFFRVKFEFAADSSVGGNITLTLPVSPKGFDGPIGNGMVTDAATENYNAFMLGTAAAAGIYVFDTSATYSRVRPINATVPITFGTGDIIRLQGCYEAA
ncbi:MAG: hypothetical protein WC374_06950 [Phycisphaerae bacterium]|jgi:hypothetical protein